MDPALGEEGGVRGGREGEGGVRGGREEERERAAGGGFRVWRTPAVLFLTR